MGAQHTEASQWPQDHVELQYAAVLMCTHNLCFEQKYEKSKKKSNENCHLYSREKSLYVAWACFRNGHAAAHLCCSWCTEPRHHADMSV